MRLTTITRIFTALFALLGGSLVAADVDLRVDWSLDDRYGLDADGDGVTDPHDTADMIQPASWSVRIDACASASFDAADPIAEFEVDVNGVPAGAFAECGFSINVAGQGAHAVSVTAVTESGDRTTVEVPVRVRDWLIVGLGDSYASGEGVPDIGMPVDGIERALAAYAAVDDARREVDDVRRKLDDALDAVGRFSDEVEAAREELEGAVAEVGRRLRELNNAIDDLREIEADVRPVQNALARFKRDCIDDFGVFRCSGATGELIAALVSYGISAAAEIVADGYNAVKSLIDNAIAAGERIVNSARSAYNRAVAAKDAAEDALQDARDAFDEAEDAAAAIAAAVVAAEEAVGDAELLLDRVNSEVRPVWQDEDCHRSAFSAQARAALALERLDPRSTVTFVHLACSGATTRGVEEQIETLAGLIGEREIDAVLMSVGGNDAGFSNMIYSLIRHRGAEGVDIDFDAIALAESLCPFVPGLSDACASFADGLPEESAAEILESGLAGLPDGYARVADALAALVEPDRVFITEYPDAARRDDGGYCDPAAAPGISTAEWQWVSEVATPSINAAVRAGADAHSWRYIDAIYELFGRHGYCADEHWLSRLEESVLVQGDFKGTAHPNEGGHEAMGEEIAGVLVLEIDDEGSLTPMIRGDCNVDGKVDISDSSKTLAMLFLGDGLPLCGDACDTNDDGGLDISDAIASLSHLFLGTGSIPSPGPASCGIDPTGDELGCESYDACP